MSSRPPHPPEHPADTSILDVGTDMQAASDQPLSQTAYVCGEVTFRTGDGPLVEIRPGPIEVEVNDIDVTVAWQDEESRLSAVIPRTEYARFIGNGSIKPMVSHRPEDSAAKDDAAH